MTKQGRHVLNASKATVPATSAQEWTRRRLTFLALQVCHLISFLITLSNYVSKASEQIFIFCCDELGERKNPRSPVNQSSNNGRSKPYEDPNPPEAQKSRSNNGWNDADKKAVTEELERSSNRQNKIETVLNQLLKDLKGSINRQVRDEMTAVVLTARSMRQKTIQELAQA